eukprot:966288-Pelagomonas_calceolata.AAC.4
MQVLYTVVTREEKYKAKLSIDSVVQRLGDTVAAAVFEVLGEIGAVECVCVCVREREREGRGESLSKATLLSTD